MIGEAAIANGRVDLGAMRSEGPLPGLAIRAGIGPKLPFILTGVCPLFLLYSHQNCSAR